MQTPAEEYGLQEACHILSPLGRTFNLLSWGTAPFQVVQLKDMHLPAFYSHTAWRFERRDSIWSKRHYTDSQVWDSLHNWSTPSQSSGPARVQMRFGTEVVEGGRQWMCGVARCQCMKVQNGVSDPLDAKKPRYIPCVMTPNKYFNPFFPSPEMT